MLLLHHLLLLQLELQTVFLSVLLTCTHRVERSHLKLTLLRWIALLVMIACRSWRIVVLLMHKFDYLLNLLTVLRCITAAAITTLNKFIAVLLSVVIIAVCDAISIVGAFHFDNWELFLYQCRHASRWCLVLIVYSLYFAHILIVWLDLIKEILALIWACRHILLSFSECVALTIC